MSDGTLHRLSAFSTNGEGGNPAGVWVGAQLPDPVTMQRIAAEVGYSETAFIAPERGTERSVRYYSPQAEVPFCGHATIASGVLLGETDGDTTYAFSTAVGMVSVQSSMQGGIREAALISVTPRQAAVDEGMLAAYLDALGWRRKDLDAAIAPMLAYAGAWHLVLAAAHSERLARLDYPFESVRSMMLEHDLTTLQLVHRQNDRLFLSRNAFPVGGVVEDPATGAAAAALGGYLRDAGLIQTPASIEVRQGQAMGRPSLIRVDIPVTGGIVVRGTAIRL